MYYFIVNKHGGSGQGAKDFKVIENWLENLKNPDFKYKICESLEPGHITRLASEISSIPESEDSDKKIILLGGDGTLNELLNGITDFSKIKLGLIPSGSGNDFARGTGIKKGSKNLIYNLEKIISSEKMRFIDLGKVSLENGTSRYFGISSGIGMDAIVCKKTNTSKLKVVLNKLHMGQLSYILLTIHSLFSMKCNDVTIKFDGEEPRLYKNLIFLAGMNLCAEGGGVKMAPDAVCDDGELSICMVQNIPRICAFFVFPFLIFGKHKKFKGFTLRNCKKLEFYSDAASTVHTDGEFAGDVNKITMECIKQKLQLLN